MKITVKNLKYAQLRIIEIDPNGKFVNIMVINRLAEGNKRPTSNLNMIPGDSLDLSSSDFQIEASVWQWLKIFITGRLIPAEPE